jgi:hypothetical protein
MTLFFQFISNKVYIGNESCNFNNYTSNMNNCLIDCEKHTNILNKVKKSHSLSLKNNKKISQLILYTHKFFPDNVLFQNFHTLNKNIAIFLLNGVLKRTGLFIQPCPQSGVLR